MLTPYLRAAADASPLIAFRAAAGGLPILVGLFLASRWGLEELAAFTVANAAVTVAATIADWGAGRALPRNLASLQPGAAARFLASSTAVRLGLALVLAAAAALARAAGVIDAAVFAYLVVLFPLCPLFVLTTNAVSQRVATRELQGIGVAVAAGVLVLVAAGAFTVVAGLGPLWFAAAYVLGRAAEAALAVAGRWWVLRPRVTTLAATTLQLWPFSVQMIVGVIYPRLAIFTVEAMTSRAELGIFSVAVALQSALLLVPTSLSLLYFPELTRRTAANDGAGVRRLLVRYTIASLLGVGAGIALVATLVTPLARALNVPASYEWLLIAYAALATLTIFSTMMPFLLQARGLEMTAARLSILTLVLGLALQIASLAWLGLAGILIASALGDLTATAILGAVVRRSWRRGGSEAR